MSLLTTIELLTHIRVLLLKEMHYSHHCDAHDYQNSGCQSYEVTLKAGGQGYGRSGVTGSAGAYNIGARTRPQLIGCALAQEPGVLNFGLGLQTVEGDEYAETGR